MKISVVIVAFNSAGHLAKCLDSVLRQPFGDKEVILIDNGSSDATSDIVSLRYPQVKLIRNSSNLGAAEARNQGIAASGGDWILALDSDAYLREDFLRSFSDFLNKDRRPYLGILAPGIYYMDGNAIYSRGHYLTFLRRFYDLVGPGRADRVFGACSATAFYRRQMLEDIRGAEGYFDRDFFYMVEDVDLSWRAAKKGWSACVCPDCVSFHAGNGSGHSAKDRIFFSVRNRFIMIAKNESKLRLFFSLPFLVLYELLRFFYLSLKGERSVYCRAVLSAIGIIRKKNTERRHS